MERVAQIKQLGNSGYSGRSGDTGKSRSIAGRAKLARYTPDGVPELPGVTLRSPPAVIWPPLQGFCTLARAVFWLPLSAHSAR